MKKYQNLADAELNRMVAECEGWRNIHIEKRPFRSKIRAFLAGAWNGRLRKVPDYIASRDAIMPCVERLSIGEQYTFSNELYLLCRRNHPDKDFAIATAPPRTVALAYLKTKGKI